MICRQWRIVQAPVLQVVKVPLGNGEMGCNFHPMSLRLKVTMHGRLLKTRISPEARSPAEQANDHENEW